MAKFKKFASNHPIGFSIVITIIFLFFTVLSGVFAYPVTNENGKQIVMGMLRIVGTGFFIWLLWRFGWLKGAGLTDPGSKRIWRLAIPAIFYSLVAYTYGFFGKFTFHFDNLGSVVSTMFNMFADGAIQEVVYRGVILYALVLVWGNSTSGLMKSVLVSALFFSAVHLFNVINIAIAAFTPVQYDTVVLATIMQVVNTFLAGFVYAAIVLYGRSIWPVILYHGVLNAAINVLWLTTPDSVETLNAWLFISISKIPLIVYGFVLMHRANSESSASFAQGIKTIEVS